jgi:hypothetical protein
MMINDDTWRISVFPSYFIFMRLVMMFDKIFDTTDEQQIINILKV